MRFDEYQQRRRALEEQLQTDLELIRMGHRAKLQALEMLWLVSSGPVETNIPPVPSLGRDEGSDAAVSTSPEKREVPPLETRLPSETQRSTETQPPRSKAIYNVQDEIEAILPRLPELFDKDDIIRTLGWEPHRATLHRALGDLRLGKMIVVETPSRGRHAARYRKLDTA